MDSVKILVIDDEARMRKLVKDFLAAKGFIVLEAENGEEGIEIFTSDKNIKLILLDVMMPKMDGFETLQVIREYSNVPVIMLTARSEERDELESYKLGVDEYITKPFSPKILVARVEAVLRRTLGEVDEKLVAGAIEIDKNACNTLKFNRPNWNVINENIANISSRNLEDFFSIKKGELDLLSGGAPCQAFSYAGKRLGLEDTRGTLFYHYALFLKKLQPKIFLFENVKGLLSHDKGKTHETIINVFKEEGYTIYEKVLNAWDYGVAQKRERLIIVGIRNDLLNKLNFLFPTPHNYKPILRDILLDCPESKGVAYSEYKKKIFELVPPGGYWKDIPKEIAKEYMKSCWDMEGGRTGILRRLSLDEPSLTILTSPSQKQTDRCHPIEARPFTIRENARCQSFPDEWIFSGSVTDQYRQVGNAVPVNLAYEVALEIRKALEML